MKREIELFSPAMVAGCEAAIEAGMKYQTEFEDFVLDHMGGLDCEPVLVRTINGNTGHAGEQARKLVETLPRGHFVWICYETAGWRPLYAVVMSDGRGIAPGTSFDALEVKLKDEFLVRKMMCYEIHKCRQALKGMKQLEANRAALKAFNFTVGMRFRNVSLDGDSTFSTASIEHISDESGMVTVLLSKRRSKKRWTTTIDASELSKCLGESRLEDGVLVVA